jgi:hypothetical protein
MNVNNLDAAKVIAQHQIRPQLDCEIYSGLNSKSAVFQPSQTLPDVIEPESREGDKKRSKKVRKGPK